MTTHRILNSLRQKGFRITNIRKAVCDVLFRSKRPLSVSEIGQKLSKQGLMANKTTLYREIEFYKNLDLIEELQLNEKSRSYEWKSDHHHHLICRECSSIERVDLTELENIFPRVQKRLKRLTRFAEIDHTLEFFGLCSRCA